MSLSRFLPHWLVVALFSLCLTIATPAGTPGLEAQIRKPGDDFLKAPPGVPGWSEMLRSEGSNSGTMCRLVKFMRTLLPIACAVTAVMFFVQGAAGSDNTKYRLALLLLFVGFVGYSSPTWLPKMSPDIGQYYVSCTF